MLWLQHRVESTFLSPYVLPNTVSLSTMSAVSTFSTIQLGGAYSIAAVQHKG